MNPIKGITYRELALPATDARERAEPEIMFVNPYL